MKKRILIIDDHADFLQSMEELLDAYEVTTCVDPLTIEDMGTLNEYDLILLDLMMPTISGLEYLKAVRDVVHRPILFLTAQGSTEVMTEALEQGGDDYLVKPIEPNLLKAKIESHLRREEAWHQPVFESQGMVIDQENDQILAQGKVLDFSPREFAIICLLAMHPEHVFRREEIYDSVYGVEGQADVRVVTQYIYQIRVKFAELEMDPIVNLWGRGYKWKEA